MKRLDDIDARLNAVSKDWRFDNVDSGVPGDEPHGVLKIGGMIVAHVDDAMDDDACEFVEHAPADIALLLRLVRSLAEAECERYRAPADCLSAGTRASLNPCTRCRIRRDLGAVPVKEEVR